MGDDPMVLLGLEGALKHYYLLLLCLHGYTPGHGMMPGMIYDSHLAGTHSRCGGRRTSKACHSQDMM
jgi:hypothetical protein